ncbi:hypothetical protein V9T40_003248 [Parthenolecanium corni]|uniref:Uncharacterized protein n=1 Tax=Parthenolecanium corni TaxID=536013 RepID=A0AAN9TQ85_9HEMI
MDAIDNPSYFALSSEAQKKFCHFLSLRRWSDQGRNSATLPNDVSGRRVSAPSQNRRNFRSLKRTNSEDTHLLVLGKPRPTDLPPLVYTSQHQRHGSAGNVNSNDLLHHDMVHCVADNKDDSDVFLSANRNGEYYNTTILAKNRIPPSGRRRHSIGSFLNRDRSFTSTLGTESKVKEMPFQMVQAHPQDKLTIDHQGSCLRK